MPAIELLCFQLPYVKLRQEKRVISPLGLQIFANVRYNSDVDHLALRPDRIALSDHF